MSAQAAVILRGRGQAVAAFLSGTAIWLLTHPFVGTRNDGAIYTLMALNWADHGAFASDLFLRYGSQDAYSLFSPLYGSLIAALGVLKANIALLLAAHLLWLAGAWMLAHRLLRGLAGHLAFVLMCAAPATYGGWSFLTAGETFLTSRPFAEALTMIGLALLIGRAWLRSALAFALALAFHPIMALVGLGAAWLMIAARRPALFLAAPLAVAAMLGLAVAHIDPFARLLLTMDDAWFAIVKFRNPFVLPSTFEPVDWTRLLCDLAPCAAAALWTKGARQRLFMAAPVAAVVCFGVSLVGGDWLRDALIVQLQLSRGGWLPAVVELPALVVLWLRLRRRDLGPLTVALLAAPALILTVQFEQLAWAPALGMSLTGLVLAALTRAGRQPRLDPALARRALQAAAILPLANLGYQAILMWRLAAFTTRLGLSTSGETGLLTARVALLVGGWAIVLLARRRLTAALSAIGLVFLVGVLTWDGRSPWERYQLSGAALPVALPTAGALLWDIDAADIWFLAGRPAYASVTQAAGLLFSRPTAMEWMRRRAEVAAVLPLSPWTVDQPDPACANARRPIAPSQVAVVCARSAGLAGVILDQPAAGAIAFTAPAPKETLCPSSVGFSVVRTGRFYYLSCASLGRSNRPGPAMAR